MAKKKKTTTKRKTKKSARKGKPSLLRSLIKWAFVAGLWGGLLLVGLFAWYAGELPDITSQATFDRKTSITVKAIDGSVIARYGEIHGNSLSIEDIPDHLIYAVVATEDRRFYKHFGIDPLGIARAMVVNAQQGRFAQGGSTITQQLAKNLFLSRERTIKRKIQEAMLAVWLEHELSKDEIITAYLNRVYLGSGAYGVDAAAMLYFDKHVKDISLREAATIAGLLKAPSRYSPLSNPSLSKERTDVVLDAMADAGYIEQAEADSLSDTVPKPGAKYGSSNAGRYFTDWIVDGLDDLIGTPSEDIIIETTLNPKIQNLAEAALTKTIEQSGEERAFTQGSVIVMQPTGAVVAMIGGKNYMESQFNRAAQAKRQPGSSFKPVVYLTAIEQGYEPDTLVIDEPITSGRYRPKNFGNKYLGEVPLGTALANSLNTISFQLTKELGVHSVIETARRLGIFSPLEPDLSLALGTSSISPLEITTAYAVLANGGISVYPYGITKITSEDGELYYQRPRRKGSRRVVGAGDVQKLSYMMSGVVEYGTGRRARTGFPVAGKTGTSQDSRDAWFVGFSDELVTSVWIGNDDNSPMKNVTGGSFPAAIWQEVMSGSRGQYRAVDAAEFNVMFDGLLERLIPGRTNLRQDTYERNIYQEQYDHGDSRRYND